MENTNAVTRNKETENAPVQCGVCMHGCLLREGQTGRCRARVCRNGQVVAGNYGKITSLALDPIEKKPLNRFYPGSYILSVGSYGCNLSCRFCQNYEIAQADEGQVPWREVSPEELCAYALAMRRRGNIGLAFTYNEPLVSWEYVRDCAMNIDLKSFRPETYRSYMGGDLETVKAFISHAADWCHLELTTLIVPGMNDSEEEMREIASWICSLRGGKGKEIPLHISRFFPRYRMRDRGPTPVGRIYRLAEIAGEYLDHIYPGNV